MQRNGYCIFYAEDDREDQQIFKDVVADIDPSHDLHIHNDGEELMEQLNSPPPRPQIIFLDLNMPKKNGIEVLKEIRQSEKFKDITVIVFTTSDDRNSIKLTKDLGADVFITKPSVFHSFKKAIAYCLSLDWTTYKQTNDQFVLSFN